MPATRELREDGIELQLPLELGPASSVQVCPADLNEQQQQQPRSLSLSLLLSFVAGNFNFVEPS